MQVQTVERAMRGDHDAFASLAAGSVDHCYGLAYRILRDQHRAEDATQQALLGAWRDLPTLRDPARFDAWLHRLVVNACYTESRGDRRRSSRVRLILNTDASTDTNFEHSIADRDYQMWCRSRNLNSDGVAPPDFLVRRGCHSATSARAAGRV